MNQLDHYATAVELLKIADRTNSTNYEFETGEKKTDVLLAALTHAILATVK